MSAAPNASGIYETSGGNPFYLLQLALMSGDSDGPSATRGSDGVPERDLGRDHRRARRTFDDGAPPGRGGRRRRRPIRARPRGDDSRDGGLASARGARRADRQRPRATRRGAAAIPFPTSPRTAGRLRVVPAGSAARRARPQRRRAGRTRRAGRRAGAPRRARRAPWRPGGGCGAARGRRGDRASRATERRALVQDRARPAARERATRRARRAPDGTRTSASRHRAVRGQPCCAARGNRLDAQRRHAVALEPRRRVCWDRAAPRAPRHRAHAADRRAAMGYRVRPRPCRGAHDPAGRRRLLPHGIRGDARVGRAGARRRAGPVGSAAHRCEHGGAGRRRRIPGRRCGRQGRAAPRRQH